MQNSTPSQKLELISIGDASEYLGISVDTLRRWEKKGRIEPLRSPGGHRYYKKQELDNLFGKRYLRDEPTIRSKNSEDEDSVQEEKSIQSSEPQTSYPKISLPSWRAIKFEEDSVKEEETSDVDNILDRPIREVKIPENIRVQVSRTDTLISPNEAYFKQQSLSVLTPVSSLSNIETPVKNQEKPITIKETKTPNKKMLIYLSITAGVVLISIAWYFLWKSSQTVLSPVP